MTSKSGKAAGNDDICLEFLKNLGPNGQAWLTNLFTAIHSMGKIPKS